MNPAQVSIHLRRNGVDPDPGLKYLREHQPIARMRLPNSLSAWLATSQAAIRAVLSDEHAFGNNGFRLADPASKGARGGFSADQGDCHGNITVYDPPEHGRLRSVIAPAFSPRRLRAMRPSIEEIVFACLDEMTAHGAPADLVQVFSLPIPSLVICELLGVPYADRTEFQRRSKDRFDCNLSPEARDEAVRESREYMAGIIIRERANPGTGVIGMIASQQGERIGNRELCGLADTLLLGGYETTAHMLSLGTWLLMQDRRQWQMVASGLHIDRVVEELLRYISVVQNGIPRVALRDVELFGQTIRAGERVLCSLPSGNRDQAVSAEPDIFDPSREASQHLAFGHGIHYCVGSALARMEMRIAFQALATKFPGLRPDDSGPGPVFRENSQVHGLESLPVLW